MSCLKRWVVGVSALVMVLALVGWVWAEDGDPVKSDQPVVKQPGKHAEPAKQPAKQPALKPLSGTALDGALARLELADDVKAKVAEALKPWKEKADADAKALAAKRTELMEKAKAETDAAKKKALMEELHGLKGPSDVELYKGAKGALKGVLSDEQLGKADELAKAHVAEFAVKLAEGQVAGWAKKGVELSADQKTKVDAEVAKLKDEVGKLEAGARNEAMGLANKTVGEIRKNVLTDDQRAKIVPAKPDAPKHSTEKPVVPPANH